MCVERCVVGARERSKDKYADKVVLIYLVFVRVNGRKRLPRGKWQLRSAFTTRGAE